MIREFNFDHFQLYCMRLGSLFSEIKEGWCSVKAVGGDGAVGQEEKLVSVGYMLVFEVSHLAAKSLSGVFSLPQIKDQL